ncbi:MAG TPA: ABC transporter permease subunit [Baekduia sp.]|uniref:ABC transporter permease n=1 Tax=Baekduia sp. TaxID=2600305 RepID=UPI002D7A156A|nr:ABC transporter permease subunit [Baekduia sp.]HET6509883.1 ABC transporter permease subunit [Baekduia sp.]
MSARVATFSARRTAVAKEKPRRDMAVLAGRCAVPLVCLALWSVFAQTSTLVPSVPDTASALWEAFSSGSVFGPLLDSLKAVLGGFAIAAVVGVLVGVGLGRSRLLGLAFEPLVTAMFATPRIILYPVMLAIFGVGLPAKLWLAVLSAVFPIILNTAAGIRDVSPTFVKLAAATSCSRRQTLQKIYLPAAAPAIMVGIRVGFSISFVTVTIAEMYAAKTGLGQLVQTAYAFQRYDELFAMVALITLIALAGNFALWAAERRVRESMT